jgi:hypothetical protein
MHRTATIRKVAVTGKNESGSSGPDTMFVVDLMEDGQIVQTRELPGKSKSYADDVVENWNSGLIQLLID